MACFRRWCYGRARKSSFTARHLVPIVDEALLALQQLAWPKGPRHVQHIYNIGQSTREAVTLADCWSHQPGRKSTVPAPASALSRSAGSRLVHRSAPQQRWGFDGEPPKSLVIKDAERWDFRKASSATDPTACPPSLIPDIGANPHSVLRSRRSRPSPEFVA
jgi:hypothetical protein